MVLCTEVEARGNHSQRTARRDRPHWRSRSLAKTSAAEIGITLTSRVSHYSGRSCDGIQLLGARLYRTDFQKASLRGADLAFSYAAGASFRGSDMRGCSLYRAEIGLGRRHSSADFTDALVDEATDIPERKVFGERRLS